MSLLIKIQGGTPNHSVPGLCGTCYHGHITQGQQVSDLSVRCTFSRSFQIPRPIVECSEYTRRNTPDKKEMEKLAWILETKRGRPIGFFSPMDHKHRSHSKELDEPEETSL